MPSVLLNPRVLCALSLAATAVLAGCALQRGSTRLQEAGPIVGQTPPGAVQPAQHGSQYAGTDACVSCHAEQHAAHNRSPHAATLRPASGSEVEQRFRTNQKLHDDILGVTYSFRVKGGKPLFRAERAADGRVQEMSPGTC